MSSQSYRDSNFFWRGGGGSELQNRSKNLAWVITTAITPCMAKLKWIAPLGEWKRMREISQFLHIAWFLPRDAMLSAVYAVVVCLCVCVCLSHSGIVSKRLNAGSRKQRRTIVHDSSFLMPNIMTKFERDHPLRGREIQVGWVKIGHFRRKTRYNLKTVQDRRIVSIKVE